MNYIPIDDKTINDNDNGKFKSQRQRDLDDLELLAKIDPSGMLDTISKFPEQIETAIELGEQTPVEFPKFIPSKSNGVVVIGMGGSAISGDILTDWLSDRFPVPILTCRGYTLPHFVNENTLVFAISYSGNTEETLAAVSDGLSRRCKLIGITSGGKLRDLCISAGMPYIQIPKGIPPRAAIAYLLFPMVIALKKLGLIEAIELDRELKDTLSTVKELSSLLAPGSGTERNIAKQLANHLLGSTPVVYAIPHFSAIARRWQTQLNENSKVLARYDEFPEMNHNDIVAWAGDDLEITSKWSAVFLRDVDEHLQIRKRIEFTKDLLRVKCRQIIEIRPKGRTILAKMMYSMYIGDFVSVYLGILRGIDPTPVNAIEALKKQLVT